MWNILPIDTKGSLVPQDSPPYLVEGLCLSFRVDQGIVSDVFEGDGDAEQGAKGGVSGAAAIEAESELVEIGLQVLFAQPVIDAERPGLEVGEDAMRPGQDDVRGHRSDNVRVVSNAGSAGVAGPAVGFRGGAGFNAGFNEGVQTRGGEVGDRRQPHPTGPVVVHFDGASDQHLAIGAAPLPAGRRIGLGAMRDHGFVDFDQARQRRAVGRDHGPAQLGAQQPGRLVRAETQLLLQLQGGDTIGVGGHQIRRPEPDGQWQLRAMHHRAGGDRGLLAATGTLPGEGLARQRPALAVATVRAAEPVGPARVSQICRTRALIREAVLKLDERARKVDHGEPSKQDVRYMFYPG